jgi:small subunit ribosomal protein S16
LERRSVGSAAQKHSKGKKREEMLAIRLARFGAKKKPTYRVVVIEKERARDSRAVEVVGYYNPVAKPAEVKLDHDRINHWLKSGAQPSDTVTRLLKTNPAPAA